MKVFMQSLRGKLMIWFWGGLLIMGGVILVNARDLNRVEDIVLAGEKATDFFDTTLEIRRFEKNYFLYGEEKDYQELLSYVRKAGELLSNSKELRLFVDEVSLGRLREDLSAYRSLLDILHTKIKPAARPRLENSIRERGKSIVTTAENMAHEERLGVQRTLNEARRTLLISVGVVMLLTVAAAFFLTRMFLQPLGRLEKHISTVADGEFSLMPVVSRDREMVSISSAFNRMLVELETRSAHLVQSEKLASMGTLLFGVAHELNNPLSNISTSTEILKEELDTADADMKRELIAQIEGETDRARDIVRSVLDYSRPGQRERFQLRKVLDEVIRFVRAEMPSRVEVVVNVSPEIEVLADPQRMKQIFLNLIKNASDAIKADGRITIDAMARAEMVEIRVGDTGEGIPADAMPRIFDPFFTTKGDRRGHGLGLFIVHGIVEEHGGTIDAISEPGHGTEFVIHLPR